jgi:hypothetical protein
MKKRTLLLTLFLLALAGLLLHYRIHNFMVHDRLHSEIVHFDGTKFLSFIFPLTDVFLVTFLFMRRSTAVYAYLLNGLIVIYGTVFMAHFSIAEIAAKSIPMSDWLLKSTLPDITIAWADFFAGKALYDLYMKG